MEPAGHLGKHPHFGNAINGIAVFGIIRNERHSPLYQLAATLRPSDWLELLH